MRGKCSVVSCDFWLGTYASVSLRRLRGRSRFTRSSVSRWRRRRLSYVRHGPTTCGGVASTRRPAAAPRSAAVADAVAPGRRGVVGRRRGAPAARRQPARRPVDRVLCVSGRCCGPVRREDVQFRRAVRVVGRRSGGALPVRRVVQQLRWRGGQLARLRDGRRRLRQRLSDAQGFLSSDDRHPQEIRRKVRYVLALVLFSARCNIIHLALMLRCQCPSVCPSVCDVCASWSQGAMDPGYLCMLG